MVQAQTNRSTVVGVFENQQQAQQAVAELHRAGFEEDQIGVAARGEGEAAGRTNDDGKNYAGEGALAGAATGAGIGALWGLGILAGALPAIGPAIAGGTLAVLLSSAAAGAAAAGLAGALIGMGISKEEAEYYEGELKSGRTVVTVKANGRYEEASAILQRFEGYDYHSRDRKASHAGATVTGEQGDRVVQAREEELRVRKEPVKTGEVKVRKEVHTEHKTLEVPVRKEEVVIERQAVSGHRVADGRIGEGEEIRVPVSEEQVHVEKQPVVKEEVRVGKRQTRDTETVTGNVRKEEIKVDKQGDVPVRDKRP